jgi:hypothetical protein
VMRCLRQEPSERFGSTSELVAALTSGGGELATQPLGQAPAPGSGLLPAAGGSTATFVGGPVHPAHAGAETGQAVSTTNPASRASSFASRRRIMTVAVGLLSIVVVGGTVASLTHRGRPNPDSLPPAEMTAARAAQPGEPRPPEPPPSVAPREHLSRPASDNSPSLQETSTSSPPPIESATPHAGAVGPSHHPVEVTPSSAGTARTAKASDAAKAKPNCTPPFVVDSAGHHQYKLECL